MTAVGALGHHGRREGRVTAGRPRDAHPRSAQRERRKRKRPDARQLLRTSGSGVARAPPRARRPLEVARSRSVPARRARGGAGRCRGARRTRRSFGAAAVTVLVTSRVAALGASATCRSRPRSTTVATARAVGLSTAPSIVRGGAGAGVATGDAGVSAWGSSRRVAGNRRLAHRRLHDDGRRSGRRRSRRRRRRIDLHRLGSARDRDRNRGRRPRGKKVERVEVAVGLRPRGGFRDARVLRAWSRRRSCPPLQPAALPRRQRRERGSIDPSWSSVTA